MLGTAQVDSATGVATLALTTLQAGRHTITAMYLGDNNVGASTSTPVTIVVSPKTGPSGQPYLIVTANDASRIYGQANPAFTYTVSGALLNGDTPVSAVKGVPISRRRRRWDHRPEHIRYRSSAVLKPFGCRREMSPCPLHRSGG